MKKQWINFRNLFKISLTCFLLILITQTSFSQQRLLKNNAKFSMELPGKFSLDYERALNSFSSISVGITAFTLTDRYKSNSGFILPPFLINGTTVTLSKTGFLYNAAYRLYLSNRGKTLNGFYLAPQIFRGNIQLDYRGKYSYRFLFISLNAKDIVKGEEQIKVLGFGLKIGYQKRWKKFNMDFGVSLSQSRVLEELDGIRLDNGAIEKFSSDIAGNHAGLYFGIGFAF